MLRYGNFLILYLDSKIKFFFSFFIYQNNEAGFGEFPWTVAIVNIEDDECVCGGSLIHPKAILTGNHCVKK